MVCIVDRLQKTLNRKISSEQIWKHLKTMYNLKALDDLEPLPFPNNEENFDLPIDLQTKLKRSESEDGETSSVKEKEIDKKTIIKETIQQKTTNTPSNKNSTSSERTERSERSERKAQKISESSERIHPKRTRGSIHHDAEGSSSPASTPPPQTKRRRI